MRSTYKVGLKSSKKPLINFQPWEQASKIWKSIVFLENQEKQQK